MSDEEQSEGGDVAGATAQDSENTVLKTLMAEIEKLKNENKQTKQALAAVMGKGEASTSSKNDPSGAQQTQVENALSSVALVPQVMYVSRERKMKVFW